MQSLPAGPELDRLIAEKVMGWTAYIDDPSLLGTDVYVVDVSNPKDHRLFQPSTNIAHAWEVVAAMEAPNLQRIESDCIIDGDGGDIPIHQHWLCSCESRDGKTIKAIGDTAPLAICLAALQSSLG